MKLAILSHSEPLWWEKIGKVVNQAKLAIPSHFDVKRYESCKLDEIGRYESF